jgi:tetratricopeptide (TPR) repeat protein
LADLLSKAEERFKERNLDAVRDSASLWTEAATLDPRNSGPLKKAVRARIWLVDHETDPAVRKEESTVAVQTAQWCGRVAPEDPGCDYWLGAALGVQARERRATGRDALPRIVELFRRAADKDPELDEAGPDRALAFLFVRAPGWPTGPGDPDLGLEHARRATERSPGHPPNWLALAEAREAAGHHEESRKALERALELARAMAEAGDPDAPGWVSEAESALDRGRGRP